MKTYQYIICGIAVLAMTGCEGFFDSNSPSAMDAATVYTNPALTEQAIAGVYEKFGDDHSYRNVLCCGFAGLNTDIEQGSKSKEGKGYLLYSVTPYEDKLTYANGKDIWGYINIMIERSNNIIEGIEQYGDTTNEKMRYYLGEAYFLRSFLYLEMVKLWGDVPPRFESISRNPDGVNIKKDNRNIIFEHLRGDLRKAAELLPWSSECPGTAHSSVGRPSKAAALALLMRNDMYYAGKGVRPDSYKTGAVFNLQDASARKALYEEVLWAAGQIMAGPNEQSKLIPSYEQIFRRVCAGEMDYYKTEVLWAIPFADGTRGQVLQYNCPKADKCYKGLKNNTSGSTNSAVRIVPTLYYEFEQGDKRRDVTMVPYTWTFDKGEDYNSESEKRELAFGKPITSDILYQKIKQVDTWYAAKYRVEWMAFDRNGNDDGVDFPVIRYADVLLMAAEASLGGVGGDKPDNLYGVDGQDCFDQVRRRAGLSSKALTMEAIQEERKFEFAGEYLRKYDLMRWGILRSSIQKAVARVSEMNLHTGIFAGLQDTIYYKFKNIGATAEAEDYRYDDKVMDVYVLDSIYGLVPGEIGAPATYSSANGWAKTCLYASSSGRSLAPANYLLYDVDHPEYLDAHQFWPIFSVNIGSSNGTLWNDYGYSD